MKELGDYLTLAQACELAQEIAKDRRRPFHVEEIAWNDTVSAYTIRFTITDSQTGHVINNRRDWNWVISHLSFIHLVTEANAQPSIPIDPVATGMDGSGTGEGDGVED